MGQVHFIQAKEVEIIPIFLSFDNKVHSWFGYILTSNRIQVAQQITVIIPVRTNTQAQIALILDRMAYSFGIELREFGKPARMTKGRVLRQM